MPAIAPAFLHPIEMQTKKLKLKKCINSHSDGSGLMKRFELDPEPHNI